MIKLFFYSLIFLIIAAYVALIAKEDPGYALLSHGDWIIEKERNEVLYKYGLLKNWDFGFDFKQNTSSRDTKVSLGLSYKF